MRVRTVVYLIGHRDNLFLSLEFFVIYFSRLGMMSSKRFAVTWICHLRVITRNTDFLPSWKEVSVSRMYFALPLWLQVGEFSLSCKESAVCLTLVFPSC